MIRNFKYLILSTLNIIAILLIVFISLAAAKPDSQIAIKGTTTSTYVGQNMGLGMVLYSSQVDNYIDLLLKNGFTELRIDIPDYQNTSWLAQSKAAVIRAVAKGAKVIWGVSSNSYNNPSYTITDSNWPAFRQAILDAAKWAQDNGVYEFQIGNEEEYHCDRWNPNATMKPSQLITNLKSVAADAQVIFTNGKISYSCAHSFIPDWISEGKGDIDILASNVYMGGSSTQDPFNDDYKTEIANLVNAFGVDGTYLTEFNLSYLNINNYSTDENKQAEAVNEMVTYINASGMKRAFWYAWENDEFGALKSDGTYRLLWNILTSINSKNAPLQNQS